MSDSRDPVVVESTRIGWTAGKAIGFIPLTIFYEDETANQANEKETLFFQTFGFGPESWQSIDEHPYPEATIADYYDAANGLGRWNYLRYMDRLPEDLDTVEKRIARAGLDPLPHEGEEPKFRLVPEWQSVITGEELERQIKAEWAAAYRAKTEARVKEVCSACAAGEKLFGDGYGFFHRREFAFEICAAVEQHRFLKTEAWALFSATAKGNYTLLKGYLNDYSRLNSSRKRIRSHSAYRKLLEMGEEAIPFILNDLRKGQVGGIWTAEVLSELIGQRGGDPHWWIEWAKARKYAEIES
jgi:hypothetical protein